MRDDPIDLHSPSYRPERLLEEAMFVLRAPDRTTLARLLEVDPALICRIWNRKSHISELVMVRIMDRTDWSIRYVRELVGMPYDGMVYPPRPRMIEVQKPARNYHLAKEHILQAMPGTINALARKSGYSRGTVEFWIKVLRAGDPLTRGSHIIEWLPPNGSGQYIPVHAAGPGKDAPRIKRPWHIAPTYPQQHDIAQHSAEHHGIT